MTSLLGERLGVQSPRVLLEPRGVVRSSGPYAAALGETCGVVLDEWQRTVLDVSMGERADDSWAASDVCLIASRQNGKNGVVEVREVFGLTVLHETIIHTSHLFTTTRESYDRLMALIEGHPDVKDRLVYSVASPASGYEMRFRDGGRIKFIARSRASGRGLTGDLLIFDEAQDLNDDAQGALLPTISARPGAQTWYFGSAPGINSTVFHRLRKRGRAGEDARLAYFEFSADPHADLDDREAWAQANPALGVRITPEAIEAERASMSDEMFARERLSVSPDLADFGGVFAREQWYGVCDDSLATDAGMFAFDVSIDRSAAAIAVCGDGPALELVDYRPGTGWLLERLCELYSQHGKPFAFDRRGPAGNFSEELQRRGVQLVDLTLEQFVKSAADFYDGVLGKAFHVRSDRDLDRAVSGAEKRYVADAWTWGRKGDVDISPLVACSLALWAFVNVGVSEPFVFA